MRTQEQIEARGGDGSASAELSVVGAPEPPTAARDGDGAGVRRPSVSGGHLQRRRGVRSARNLARRLRAGRQVSPHQELLLALTARLATHALNASLTLCEQGETRADGEPRQLLTRLESLTKQVADNLHQIFGDSEPDGGGDLLAALTSGGKR